MVGFDGSWTEVFGFSESKFEGKCGGGGAKYGMKVEDEGKLKINFWEKNGKRTSKVLSENFAIKSIFKQESHV